MWDPETGPVSGQCIRACSTVLGTQMGVQEKPRVSMSNNMAKIAEARKTVEQLKLEVSQAAAELLAFCETHAKDDPLVTPVPAAENPFRDKRLFCVLL
ncbi:guanine nucleotide-binding protein G(I)/G(S)/G(O) subunit gamma-8 isoform X2 [Lagenorhynchus albirostris]|uniref:guanine nucleotide-binding protein G(I)/G(S)/G(O) subunit gamma-8 isoform X2 n=1 Tax=Lagenorhynchus albirostris TaxID=27610 RepID=UPI0028E4E7DC|nr:guanine nucleotide-binding protein G(I)/G(S)/G(O) subunit gamma-8 isoform X2 [Lagenorhynchus albirostris]